MPKKAGPRRDEKPYEWRDGVRIPYDLWGAVMVALDLTARGTPQPAVAAALLAEARARVEPCRSSGAMFGQ